VVLTDKRRFELENQMIKATADKGEQRLRERAHYEEQINERDNQILDLKERVMKRDLEVS
tara:strand:- start:536 stop:715 length:180 start_codon:yes stop_codon:yes gene_type:complete